MSRALVGNLSIVGDDFIPQVYRQALAQNSHQKSTSKCMKSPVISSILLC